MEPGLAADQAVARRLPDAASSASAARAVVEAFTELKTVGIHRHACLGQSGTFNSNDRSRSMKFTYVVFTNAVPGREEEFNDWYSNTHIPDLLRVPGIQAAQRFRRSTQQRTAGPHSWEYLALYQCDAAEPKAVTDAIQSRIGTPQMTMSDACAEARYSCYFEPITELMRSEGVAQVADN
jgi:hypothetical protein